jgi:hypothetical protein
VATSLSRRRRPRQLPFCIAPFSQHGYDNFPLGHGGSSPCRRSGRGARVSGFSCGAAFRQTAKLLRQLRPALERVKDAALHGVEGGPDLRHPPTSERTTGFVMLQPKRGFGYGCDVWGRVLFHPVAQESRSTSRKS